MIATLRIWGSIAIVALIAALAFALGLAVSATRSHAEEVGEGGTRSPRVVYPKETRLDFNGLNIEGELKNPAELYFSRRPEEKFDSLVKRRPNFHREMLRDAVMSR